MHIIDLFLIINISQCLVTRQQEDENFRLPGISEVFSNQFPAAGYVATG